MAELGGGGQGDNGAAANELSGKAAAEPGHGSQQQAGQGSNSGVWVDPSAQQLGVYRSEIVYS